MTEANAMDGMLEGLKLHNISLKEGQLAYMVCKPKASTGVSSSQAVKEYEQNYLQLNEPRLFLS